MRRAVIALAGDAVPSGNAAAAESRISLRCIQATSVRRAIIQWAWEARPRA